MNDAPALTQADLGIAIGALAVIGMLYIVTAENLPAHRALPPATNGGLIIPSPSVINTGEPLLLPQVCIRRLTEEGPILESCWRKDLVPEWVNEWKRLNKK
ncbi:MAG: hypothetical protein A2747_00480 [Candidatus Yonathbacteria bacterium RIFCSPHIGHO2_01_FULL_44_41]|nr:MAG: hypothetical protein A2747_00480 [Candidatus Yonathbacteria bacterium RIFCSPHIGHO2_01_FULL_44_41]OHA80771.1 MAG: hypothetical protein A3B06_02845 [Candidatus Yonathbacteria bacterium RIFCSPLOWO2_01_FULL_43_20]